MNGAAELTLLGIELVDEIEWFEVQLMINCMNKFNGKILQRAQRANSNFALNLRVSIYRYLSEKPFDCKSFTALCTRIDTTITLCKKLHILAHRLQIPIQQT